MDPKSSLSLLSEIKDIASKEAENERNQTHSRSLVPSEETPAERSPKRKTTGSRRASSLNLELSQALADVHNSVSQKAEEEERKRRELQELSKQADEAKRRAQESHKAQEVEARIRAEEARQKAAHEERRLKLIKLEYEAALARGEQVEMPEELKPKPIPQEVLDQVQGVAPVMIQAPPPAKRNPAVLWGSLAATVMIAALGGYLYMAKQEEERLRKAEEARIAAEEKRRLAEEKARQLALMEQQRKEREEREAKLKAELAAAIAAKEEAERKREEEEQNRKDRKKRSGKRTTKKKNKIKGINLSGF